MPRTSPPQTLADRAPAYTVITVLASALVGFSLLCGGLSGAALASSNARNLTDSQQAVGESSGGETRIAAATRWERDSAGNVTIIRDGQDPVSDGPSGRLGLHYTGEELSVWRERAGSGPYRVAGDVSTNSPGDWQRVVSNKNAFIANPRSENRWNGPSVSGCVEADYNQGGQPPRGGPSNLRDAAFFYLVTGDEAVRDTVKAELLAQAKMSGVDFSNRSRWCAGRIRDISPSFPINNWLTKLLYAYDYLGADSFTASERALLNGWFYQAANFWQMDLNNDLNRLFVDRWNGDYRLTSTGSNTNSSRVGYFNGKPTYSIHRFYNNRRGQVARFMGLTAIKLSDEGYTAPSGMSLAGLHKTAKLWTKEWVTYSVFPEGFTGDFERWRSDHPDLGWQYSVDALVPTLTIADAYARTGDRELIDFSTRQGALGTQASSSQPAKSLQFAVRSMGHYVDGTHARYGTDQSSRNGNNAYRIDGVNEASKWYAASDIQFAPINVHYQDNYIKSLYLRTGTGMRGYPSNPASTGQHIVWAGDWGTYPATLFMYGQP